MRIPQPPVFRRSLAVKLTVPYLLLAFVLALAVLYVVARMQATSIAAVFSGQLGDARTRVADSVVRTEQLQLAHVRTMARLQGLAEAVADGNSTRTTELVTPYAVSQGVERVIALDGGNRALVHIGIDRATVQPIAATDFAEELTALLQQTPDQQGDKHAALFAGPGDVVLYTSAPLYIGQERVGTLLIGTTAQTLVARWRSGALADVTLYGSDGVPLSTSFGADAMLALQANRPAAGQLQRELVIDSRTYSEVITPLVLRDSETPQLIGVALSKAGLTEIISQSKGLLLAIFGSGIAASIVIGVTLSRRITQPVKALAQTTAVVAAGDFSQVLPVTSADEIGALTNSFNAMIHSLRKANQELVGANDSISQLNDELLLLNDELLETLARFFDARDPYVGGHSAKVADYATAIARELGLTPERMKTTRQAALLHDIGKIAISEQILHKPGKLTDQEYEELKTHVIIGAELLGYTKGLRHLAPFVRHHHERWDGKGYPDGLHRHQIPLEARILNICDSVEAMASDRPYHKGMSFDEVIAEVKRCAGTQFDPTIVDVFVRIAEQKGESFIINSADEVRQRQALKRSRVE